MAIFAFSAQVEPVWDGLFSILLLLGVAAILGTLAEHLRQSAIVGYLLAGTLVGPNAIGLVGELQALRDIGELGVALLLFAIGLEFSVQDLFHLGRSALRAGALQILTTLGLTTAVCSLFLSWQAALVIGAMVALSSTACVVRVLSDRAELDSPAGKLSLAVLLLQDAAVVPLILVVSVLNRHGTLVAAVEHVALVLAAGAALVAVLHAVFSYLAPPLFAFQARYRNRDLPILLAIVLALGSAWAAHRAGVSPAMGAFVAGALLAASPFANQIRADIGPVRTTLVTLFFASVGMFGNPRWLLDHVALVTSVVLCVVAGKIIATTLAAWWAGNRMRFAASTGMHLAQIGEFSFVLATIAYQANNGASILDETTFQAVVSATIVTLLLTPYMIQGANPIGVWFERRLASLLSGVQPGEAPVPVETPPSPRGARPIVIIGFGPAGQRVAEDLLAHHYSHVVAIDLNPNNLEVAHRYGLRTVLGDALQRDILEHAGIRQAIAVVVTVPTPSAARTIIQLLRHEAPGTLILARARYHIYRWALIQAGAHVVIDEEDGIGHALAQKLLEALREPTEQ